MKILENFFSTVQGWLILIYLLDICSQQDVYDVKLRSGTLHIGHLGELTNSLSEMSVLYKSIQHQQSMSRMFCVNKLMNKIINNFYRARVGLPHVARMNNEIFIRRSVI